MADQSLQGTLGAYAFTAFVTTRPEARLQKNGRLSLDQPRSSRLIWYYCMVRSNKLYGTVWLQYEYSEIPMPSAECMGLYRGGLLSNRSELDAMGGMPLGV